MSYKPSRETLIRGISVILRVPSLFIAEAWYRTDPKLVHSNYVGKDTPHEKTGEVFILTAYYSSKCNNSEHNFELNDNILMIIIKIVVSVV